MCQYKQPFAKYKTGPFPARGLRALDRSAAASGNGPETGISDASFRYGPSSGQSSGSRIDIQLPPVYSIFYIGTQVLASESSGAETLTTHCPPEAPSRLKLGKAVRIRRGCATVYGVEVYWVTGSCGEQMSWTLTSSMPREPGILPGKAEL